MSAVPAASTSEPSIPAGSLALATSRAAADEVNFDYAATTPALESVLRAVIDFVPRYASVHRSGGRRSSSATEAFEVARAAIASFVGLPEEGRIILVRNTTEAANTLAAALPHGSRVLCSPFEHHANLLPWRRHDTHHLPFVNTPEDLVLAAEETLTQAHRSGAPFDLLAISGASNVTGEVIPVDRLATVAHEHGARIFVDAAQLAPHRSIDLATLGVDFLAFSGHKLYAPFGAGVLAVGPGALENGTPLLRGGGAVRFVSLEAVLWAGTPSRYEAGTPNAVGVIALAAACRALSDYGMHRLERREAALSRRLRLGLSRIPGVRSLRMWAGDQDHVGVESFIVAGQDSRDVARRLADDHRVAVRAGAFCAHPLVTHLLGIPSSEIERIRQQLSQGGDESIPGAIRASIGLGVTESDVDHLLGAIESIATSDASRRLRSDPVACGL